MRSIAVVQWSRLGDLLQTRGLLRALRHSDPEVHLTLFADAHYAEVVCRLRERPEFVSVNLSDWSGQARHAVSQADLLRCLTELLSGCGSRHFDDVYVLTRSLAAVFFAGLLRADRTHGYRFDEDRLIAPEQVRWIEERHAQGLPAVIHLSDLWASLAPHASLPDWPPVLGGVEEGEGERSKQIAFLCDAGETYRCIPEPWLTGLAERILSLSESRIALLGRNASPSNAEWALLEKRFGERLVDYRGRTNLAELCSLLSNSDVAVGPDTGGLHLACALHVPVIGLYFGGAAAACTGPYGARAVVLENPEWSDRERNIVTELIASAPSFENAAAAIHDIRLLSPQLDEFGITFPSHGGILADETASARREFFARFRQGEGGTQTSGKRVTPSELAVIIPECGATFYTDELLSDLESQLEEHAEIILVCSGPSASCHLPHHGKNVRCLRVSEPLTFAQACNLGSQRTQRKWLLFLNNDTRLPPGSLRALLDEADEKKLLTPVLRYPDGLIQNCGVSFRNGDVIEIGHGLSDLAEKRAPDALSAVALLLCRMAFEHLNGFDESFRNGYEDLDLCLRAAQTGMRVKVCENSAIVHFRGSTQGRFAHDETNRALFMERWSEHIRKPIHRAAKRNPDAEPLPLVIVSDEPAEAAGSCLRWIWPLERCGLKLDRDFRWICASHEDLTDNDFLFSIAGARAIIVFRPLRSASLQDALLSSLTAGASLWVDVDDLFFGRFSGSSERARWWQTIERGFDKLLRHTRRVTVSTRELQTHMHRRGCDTVLIETQPSAHQLPKEERAAHDALKSVIGFFGSPSHLIDLGSVLPALESVLERHTNSWFYWWGCRPGELAYHPRVRQGGPLVKDYRVHLARLHHFGLDAAVVPLLDSPFNRCKSPVKFFEYALAGVPAVYAALPPYTNAVRHGQTGLLADDATADWVKALDTLIEDTEIRSRIAGEARNEIQRRIHDPDSDTVFRQMLTEFVSAQEISVSRRTTSECPA